jgi:hypothetical protein
MWRSKMQGLPLLLTAFRRLRPDWARQVLSLTRELVPNSRVVIEVLRLLNLL